MQKNIKSSIPYNFPISKRMMWRGGKIFILFSILGLLLVYLFNDKTNVNLHLRTLQLPFLLLVAVLTGCDYMLGACRIYYMTRVLGKRIRFVEALKADFSNTFLSAVTPLQTGGGPAQLYILYKAGLQVGEAMAVSFMNFIFTCTFLFSMSGFVVVSGYGSVNTGMLMNLFRFSYLFFCFLVVLGIIIRFKPAVGLWFVQFFKQITHFAFPRYEHWIDRLFNGLVSQLGVWWNNFSYLFREKKLLLIGGYGITLILFTNKYSLSYCVIRGLGLDVGYSDVLLAMVVLNALLYFTPTPGASGVAEVAAATIMTRLIPGEYTIAYTVIWRLFSSYLGVTIGGIVLFKAILSSIGSVFVKKETVPEYVSDYQSPVSEN